MENCAVKTDQVSHESISETAVDKIVLF